MPIALERRPLEQKNDYAKEMKALGDEAAEILKLHDSGQIDGEEAAKRLYELKNRHRTFLDRLVG
ncbi:MAG TPA: hypothetical protein VNR11_16640 [Xanthobacteraceae bacterium]|nr:hypothetical protein [Xanthobacteraceae bacterium]